MKTERDFSFSLSLCLEYKTPLFVRVKSYKRLYNGKVVKVRSHYRRISMRFTVERRALQ